MIPTQPFGRTGHASSRIIFGAYALSRATRAQADQILDILFAYGVNHIDTAPTYGNAEKCIGAWMKQHRDKFFIATKSRSRDYERAKKNLQDSLARLNVDHNTYFYDPLESQEAVEKAVQWAMGLPGSFVISAGDMLFVPQMLAAAEKYEQPPTTEEMNELIKEYGMQQVFK